MNDLINYLLNPYFLVNVLWMLTAIIITIIIEEKNKF